MTGGPTLAWLEDAAWRRLGRTPEARRDVRRLLAAAMDRPRSYCLAHPDRRPDRALRRRFLRMLERRRRGEPVAYILGERGFWSLTLTVNNATLIPRPETELLVERTLAALPAGPARIADLGTGCGAVALALAHERPHWRVVATDRDPAALAVARGNARRLGLTGRVDCRRGLWFEALWGDRWDVVVSNPPYVADADPHLHQGDLRFEPRDALAGGPEGLDAIRHIVAGAPRHLRPGGRLLLEHGHDQAPVVAALLAAAGFTAIDTHHDSAGHPRITEAVWVPGSDR